MIKMIENELNKSRGNMLIIKKLKINNFKDIKNFQTV